MPEKIRFQADKIKKDEVTVLAEIKDASEAKSNHHRRALCRL
jgi:hypothetical protein